MILNYTLYSYVISYYVIRYYIHKPVKNPLTWCSGNSKPASCQHCGSRHRSSEAFRVLELDGGVLPLLPAPGRPQCTCPAEVAQVGDPPAVLVLHSSCFAAGVSRGCSPLFVPVPFWFFVL